MEKQIKVIICADDGEWSRENTDALASRGAQVVTVNRNGTALLTKIRDEKPDVVVMDLFMAGVDALGVMHVVKAEGLPKPVFIITAAYSSNALERQIMEAGADYYAIQPFSKPRSSTVSLRWPVRHSIRQTAPAAATCAFRSRRSCTRLACRPTLRDTTIFGIPSSWPLKTRRLSMR